MGIERRQSLEAKLCFLFIALLFVVILGVGHVIISEQQDALTNEQKGNDQALGRTLSQALEVTLSSGSLGRSHILLKEFRTANPDLDYVTVTDSSGTSVLSDFARKRSAEPNRDFLQSWSRAILGYAFGTGEADHAQVFRSTVPIRLAGGRPGVMAIGFSLGHFDTLDTARAALMGWFAVALVLGVAGSVLFARGMTAQIRAISRGTWRVMAGDLTVQVPIKVSDEIGELTMAFNQLVVQLDHDRQRLEQRANTDSLTGLNNHRFFQERLSEEIKRGDRHGRDLALLMMDLDHFKAFNDTHGHPAGDTALRAVGTVLRASVRDIDVVGRYGGEEFAVIMPECSLEDAVASANRIRLAIQRHCFYGKDDEIVPMTVSIGVAHYPDHSQEREGLIFAADVALYQSKSLGRNRVTCYTGTTAQENEDAPYKFSLALHATELSTVEWLAEAVDAKHAHPRGFSRSVADLATRIAARLGLSDEDVKSVRIASLLRDIGQIGISDDILQRDGPLTGDERRMLESHPSLGHAIVERSPHFRAMLPGILHHHERWDGQGYPFGLTGEQIPIAARVVAIADAYRAMTVDRPHRRGLAAKEARDEIVKCAGSQFDPKLVDILLRVDGEDPAEQAA